MLQHLVFIILGLFGLYYGGEWLVRGASRLALSLGISSLIIATTIVAIGTSMPELLVSLTSAFQGVQGIALGNVIGSNIANIGLILGLAGFISAVAIQPIVIRREIPIMLACTVFTIVLLLDGFLSRLDGLFLLLGFAAFSIYFYLVSRQEQEDHRAEFRASHKNIADINKLLELVIIAAGIGLLIVGANLLVEGAKNIAEIIGIPDMIIGITLVAVGTSLPELATSISAARHQESDIAVGNIIGSNIANLLLILGATAFILPFPIANSEGIIPQEARAGLLAMAAFTILLLPFAINHIITRRESLILLAAYIVFIFYSFFIAPVSPL